ncbi:hypothetical protein DID78_04385 [Candidatus Marinamargulisbacteria bacterium SCGC AG-343-D04]|nr:hypothetical protein DID78_04385 [Candidatus Marinamargulisbacteria bacterium SCGC AG-343-D04]
MIKKVWLKGVRNLKETTVSLESHKHCYIFGSNNHGKTSILEGIYLAIHRSSPIQEEIETVIQYNQSSCIIGIDFEQDDQRNRLYASFNQEGKKEQWLNQKKVRRNPIKNYTADYISADILHLFQKDPYFRRRYLDTFCGDYFEGYIRVLKNYEKQLRQRNKYLKHENCDHHMITIFNAELVRWGGQIVRYRKRGVALLEESLKKDVQILNFYANEVVGIVYDTHRIDGDDDAYEERFAEMLDRDIEKEKIVGYTLSGPHRDDYRVLINEKNCYDHFSRGINRGIAILIKKAQCELSAQKKKGIIYLLDDVFAEIDRDNTKNLLTHLGETGQVFYATTEKEHHPFFENKKIYKITHGELMHEPL